MLADFTIKRELCRTATYVLQEAVDRNNTSVILLTIFTDNANYEGRDNIFVQKCFAHFQKCQASMRVITHSAKAALLTHIFFFFFFCRKM